MTLIDPLGKKLFETIRLPEISLDFDGPYTMSYSFCIEKLLSSLKEVGILNPPVLTTKGQRGYEIVCGLRRISALKLLGIDKINAWIIHDEDPFTLLKTNFYDNLATRDFNLVEKAMIIKRLDALVPKEETFQFLSLLNLKPDLETIDFCKWLTALPEGFKVLIAHDQLSLKSLKTLRALLTDDLSFVIDIFTRLKMSKGYQDEFIETILDISLIRGQPFSSLPLALKIQEISLSNQPGPQRIGEIIRSIREYRYPKVSSAYESFKRLKKDIETKDAVTLEINPSFEENHYNLRIRFRDGIDLKEKLKLLMENPKVESIPELAELSQKAVR